MGVITQQQKLKFELLTLLLEVPCRCYSCYSLINCCWHGFYPVQMRLTGSTAMPVACQLCNLLCTPHDTPWVRLKIQVHDMQLLYFETM
jgi:hypothetical protein